MAMITANVICVLITTCIYLGVATIILPLLPYWIISNGGKSVWIGLGVASHGLGSVIGAPILGSLSDRFGRRTVILPAIFISSLCYGGMALVELLPWPEMRLTLVVFARFVFGLCSGVIGVLIGVLLDESVENGSRSSYIAAFTVAETLAIVAGFGIGSRMAKIGFVLTCTISFGVLIALMLILAFVLRGKTASSRGSVTQWNIYGAIKFALQSRSRFAAFCQILLFNIGFGDFMSNHAVFLNDRFGVKADEFGLFLLCFGLATVLGQASIPFLLRSIKASYIAAIGMIIAAVTFFILPFVYILSLSVFTFSVGSVGVGLTNAAILAVIIQFTRDIEKMGGVIMGIAVCSASFGQIIGALALSGLYSSAGPLITFLVSACLVFLSAMIVPGLFGMNEDVSLTMPLFEYVHE